MDGDQIVSFSFIRASPVVGKQFDLEKAFAGKKNLTHFGKIFVKIITVSKFFLT
jgi:hypothetical protein